MAREPATSVRRRGGGEALAAHRKDRRAGPDLTRTAAPARHRQRRPPTTRLFVSTDVKLGNEEELFRDLKR